MLSVAEHLAPYNGTNFTLSGLAQLDGNVDTNITATGVWSESGTPQVLMSPPYMTSMEFWPLTTSSSREYVLNFTFMPTDNSPFITSNSASLVYSLAVQRKLCTVSCFYSFDFNPYSLAIPYSHHHGGITSTLFRQWLWRSQSYQLLLQHSAESFQTT